MNNGTTISLAAALIVSALTLGGCSTSTEVAWQANGMPRHEHPWQDWWNYKFIYHPNAQVYYEPYTERYFWYQDGAWRKANVPPRELELEGRLAQVVNLREQRPHLQHETVLAWHPCLRELPEGFDSSLPEQVWIASAEQSAE